MPSPSPRERVRENAVEIVSTLVTGLWLTAMVMGFKYWLALLLFGYVVVVPLTALVFGDDDALSEWWDDNTTTERKDATVDQDDRRDALDDDRADALETLRERYARGDLTDEQFERKLERLLETETLEDVESRHQPDATRTSDHGEPELEPESER